MIISITNPKGGVGKSTLAVNLTVEAMKDGWEDVAILELDPQRTAHLWSKLREKHGVKPPVEVELVETVKALRAGCGAYQADRKSLLVVDCAGTDSQHNRVAIEYSDLVIIPTRPSQAEVFALLRAVSLARELGKEPYVLSCGAFPQSQGKLSDLAEYVQTINCKMMSSTIRYRSGYQDAYMEGKSVTEYTRDPAAAYEIRQLMEEITNVLEVQNG